MGTLLHMSYDTERWIPGYTANVQGVRDALIFTVERDAGMLDRAFLFMDPEFGGGAWILWGSMRVAGQPIRGPIEWTTNLEFIEGSLLRWIKGTG